MTLHRMLDIIEEKFKRHNIESNDDVRKGIEILREVADIECKS